MVSPKNMHLSISNFIQIVQIVLFFLGYEIVLILEIYKITNNKIDHTDLQDIN